jgi:hypothetical protein
VQKLIDLRSMLLCKGNVRMKREPGIEVTQHIGGDYPGRLGKCIEIVAQYRCCAVAANGIEALPAAGEQIEVVGGAGHSKKVIGEADPIPGSAGNPGQQTLWAFRIVADFDAKQYLDFIVISLLQGFPLREVIIKILFRKPGPV